MVWKKRDSDLSENPPCYVGGVGSPAAGGRNVIMMGFWSEYNVPMDFLTWMKYGLPMVPLLGVMVAVYMLALFGKKIKTRDLTPGLVAIKEESRFSHGFIYLIIIQIFINIPLGHNGNGITAESCLVRVFDIANRAI